MIDFFERLDQFIEYKGLNDNKITIETGISNGLIGKARKRGSLSQDNISKILHTYPELNANWLFTGKEKMTIRNSDMLVSKMSPNMSPNVSPNSQNDQKRDVTFLNKAEKLADFRLRSDSNLENQSVPLYDLEAIAGLEPLFTTATESIPMDFIQIPNLPKCDGAVHIKGDSMYPLLKAGDIVLYKELQDIENDIFYGEMYLLSLDMAGDEYVTVKYIQKAEKEGNVMLVSQNINHQPKEIKLSKIRALALVKASVRINSMN